jgi:GT2 family glycosyltransferase
MTLILGVPTLNRYDLLNELVASAERGSLKPDRYYIVDNGGQIDVKVAEGKLVLPMNRAIVYQPGRNLGVAASWNLILKENYEKQFCAETEASTDEEPIYMAEERTVIIAGDDIVLGDRTLELMVAKARESTRLFICANGASAWSLFLQKPELARKIGWYDEKFWPAYYEDNDYHRRMLLAGEDYEGAVDAAVTHKRSSTIEAMSKEERTAFDVEFNKNQRYYGIKWGGPPGHETLASPAPNSEAER